MSPVPYPQNSRSPGSRADERDVGDGVVLRLGRSGDPDPGLPPRPLRQPRAVEAVAGVLFPPVVGHADLALGRGHRPSGRTAGRDARHRSLTCARLAHLGFERGVLGLGLRRGRFWATNEAM